MVQTFEENSTLEGILGELIVPAVKRKELALREKGLVCLGLCCLIARVSRPYSPAHGTDLVLISSGWLSTLSSSSSPKCNPPPKYSRRASCRSYLTC